MSNTSPFSFQVGPAPVANTPIVVVPPVAAVVAKPVAVAAPAAPFVIANTLSQPTETVVFTTGPLEDLRTVVPPTIVHTTVPPVAANNDTITDSVKERIKNLEGDRPKTPSGKIAALLVLGVLVGVGYAYRKEAVEHVQNVAGYVKGGGATKVAKVEETVPVSKFEPANNVPEPEEAPQVRPEALPAQILEVRDYYIRVLNEDQTVIVRTGGSRSWRLANPCSILYGKFAKESGAIGKADKYAVFPTQDAGRKACYDLLFVSDHGYKNLKVAEAIRRYAPLKEGFKTDKYLKAVAKLKINTGTEMTDLSEAKRNQLIDMFLDVEDFIVGRVVEFDSKKDFKARGY